MSLYPPPEIVESEVFSRMPDSFRRNEASAWANANKAGAHIHSFLEGPSFDRDGNLYVTDIPFGRVFRIDPAGEWTLVTEYDGWPNGLKIHKDGRIFITDYKRGIVQLDPATGAVVPVIETNHSESFKGVNDLVFASNGDLYFTDQGQTGWHDPTGRVFRLTADGVLQKLIDTVPSPNGIVLSLNERQIFISVTRALAVWRLPLMGDGMVSKAGTFIQLSGGLSGPDGMAVDEEGGLVVTHAGMAVWRFDRLGQPTHRINLKGGLFGTNCAFGGPENRTLFITESESGTVLRADLPVAGRPMFSHQ
ncbi:SMP-30/gluconolactonase/LRE family protein [Acuticoccus kandeliae]|uniref:SMP-30/gluconolactonase/LRE family protein n=1 Tax=Acuticoccus kandeliae TaxID=2073160 RepID=UPI000D3E8178|nr:SMP-30/gluconolactonase/LRE family protein [Acuticoccus kandeliae]